MLNLLLVARGNDWHIDIVNHRFKRRVNRHWACGKTIPEAILQWQLTAASHDLPEDYVLHISKDRWTQRCLAKPSLLL